MFKKKIYNYKLNTLGIEYFKRVTLRSGEIVFIKTTRINLLKCTWWF